MTPSGEPYLSLVVTARNDNHGGDLLGRMQAFTSGWIEQARRFQVPSELIIVEWNPPADRPPLAQALAWPDDFGPCTVRLIQVSRELHNRFAHADALPLYQMIAKNVGIRRARGQFILATNIDILFSSELAQHFAERRLKPGRMYRMDRHDAMSEIPAFGIEAQLAYCRTHLIRVNTREGSFNVTPDGRPTLSATDVAPAGSGLLFGRGWMPVERYIANEPFRWAGERAELLIDSAPEGARGLRLEIEPGPGTGGAPLDLEIIGEGNRTLARVTVSGRSRLRLPLDAPMPARLWLRVHGGGAPAPRDPRTLNFRLFHLDWERQAGAAASVESIGGRGLLSAAWNALQHVINKLAHGGPLVDLTVPVSPRLRRVLKAYLDWNGVIGMARHAIPYWKRRRRFRASAPAGMDVFAPNSGLAPGAGWKLLEEYRGEAFRRAASGAELVVSPQAPGETLGLQIEVEAADIVLLDAVGKEMARRHAEGVDYIAFETPPAQGRTRVFRLGFFDAAGAPVEAKVFWCGWTGGAAVASAGVRLAQPWGAGWRWDSESAAMTVEGDAELVVRTFAKRRPLYFEVESPAAVDFELRDAAGAPVAAFRSAGREQHRLDLPLDPNRTHLLTLSASGPFRAYHCDWNESGASSTPGTPAFLHTNACGDFTLMAREHWFDLRGYPEFDLFSMNIDSVFCFTAHYGGAREEMLGEPMRIYHIEHGAGSGWTPEGQAKLFERIAAKGLSFVDNEEVLIWGAQMNKLASPMIFNHDDWGMEKDDLPETVLPATK
jgi:hypothetical protein